MPPRLLIAADHAGFALKNKLKTILTTAGWKVEDLTPIFKEGDDYPAIGKKMALAIRTQKTLGILLCGTGAGMEIMANRFRGVRAVVAHTPLEARLAREHNHTNILVLGARLISTRQAQATLHAWLKTTPSRAARHLRRIQRLDKI